MKIIRLFLKKHVRRSLRLCRTFIEMMVDLSSSFFVDEGSKNRYRRMMRPHIRQKIAVPPSIEKIKSLKDYGVGRRCFLLGTAPSIKKLDLSKIVDSKDYVFLVNKGYLLEKEIGKNPNAIMIANPHAFLEYGKEALEIDWEHVFISSAIAPSRKGELNDCIYFSQWEHPSMKDGFFQFNATEPLYHANTVMLSALQMAVWMAFKRIYIAGVDLEFLPDNPHFYVTRGNELERSASVSEKNAQIMYEGFSVAAGHLKNMTEVEVINVGVGGKLDQFKRSDWDSLF